MAKVQSLSTKKAFSTIEILLAVGLFSVISLGLTSAIFYTIQSNALLSYKIKASYLADEGIQAVQNIRDASFANLTNGTYGLNIQSNSWTLAAQPDVVDGYTRTIVVSSVDTNTKKIVSRVSWPQQYGEQNFITFTSYLTNWKRTVANPTWNSPITASTINMPGNQNALKVLYKDNYAYVLRQVGAPELTVYDISNSASPTSVSSLTINGTSTSMTLNGNFLYITSQDNASELKVVNITNPLSPALARTYNAPGNTDATGIFVNAAGTTAYLTRKSSSEKEFEILNLSTLAITLTGSLEIGVEINDVRVIGNYAYLAASSNSQEIRIINITIPAVPVASTFINLAGNQNALTLDSFNNNLFIGTSLGNLFIVNVTAPLLPTVTSTYYIGTATSVNDIVISSDQTKAFLATADTTKEFIALNISTPATPVLLSSINAADILNGIDYNSTLDKVYAVGNSDTTEFSIYSSN